MGIRNTDDLTADQRDLVTSIDQYITAAYPSLPDTYLSVRYDHLDCITSLYKDYENVASYCLNTREDAFLKIMLVTHKPPGYDNIHTGITELQVWGVLKLSSDYGHIFIRRETMSDKINELFNKRELHFSEDKTFSRNFYVLASDEYKARMLLDEPMRTFIKEQDDKEFVYEINDSQLLFGNRKLMTQEEVERIIDMAADMPRG